MSEVHPCGAPGLGLWDRVSCYCERGADPAFWAEPLNAMSNLAFLVAALMAYADLRAARPERGGAAIVALILLTVAIGAGSFLFHTLATRWAALADVIPIGVFVLCYTALAWRRFLGLPVWGAVAVAGVVTVATFAMPPALHGSTLYLPALLMLAASAILLWRRGHRVWPWLAAAACAFAVSLTLRTLDPTDLMCGPRAIGSHWAWHVLNAGVLYLLLRAAIEDAAAEKFKPRARR